jgi:hypothetical protein
LQEGIRHVIGRLESCDTEPAAESVQKVHTFEARQLSRTITIQAIRESPDLIEAAVKQIAAFVSDLPAKCQPLTIRDRALQVIAARTATLR